MAVLKCKMCGGTLDVTEGMTVCECEYCGTTQTVTTAKDENLQALFNRANILRMKSEFDKAETLYEKLVQSNPDDAEAHWGLILCKFGIEYVEDPQTFKRIPTCHRTSFDSIVADEDYKEAVRCADSVQRDLYEREAKEIDRIQKEILALSAKEEPYDVFICYKETDEGGSRTQDSVIANDIYYQLKTEGFKVFYAAITLEDKLGSAYEPCIFAALNSAKVMLAIGTKPEYFNAVWVKNEWSRFLKMMKKDRSKLLIPCYKNMDAYELPEEFAHLQAQDMSKIGFINDIVRGIKKVVRKDEPKPAAKVAVSTAIPSVNPTVNSLLKRAFIFLEDGDWKSADEYCEKVLDLDPENGEAYLGKLMAELKIRKRENLKNCAQPFDSSSNYQKLMRYGDSTLTAEMQGCTDFIKKRNLLAYQESIYQKAAAAYNKSSSTKSEITEAKKLFESISDYKDARDYVRGYEDRIKEVDYIEATTYFRNMEEYEKKGPKKDKTIKNGPRSVTVTYKSDPHNEKHVKMIKGIFEKIPDYKDSVEYIKKCDERLAFLENQKKQKIYDSANEKLAQAKTAHSGAASPEQYQKAIELFDAAELSYQDIKDFQDSDARIQECESLIAECKEKKRGLELAAQQAAARKKKITAAVVSAAAIIAAAAACLIIFVVIPDMKYNNAVSLMNAGKYDEAAELFNQINGYKDSSDKLAEIIAEPASIGAKNSAFISAEGHTVGLKRDGTVVAAGDNDYGQCDVSGWNDIIAVSAGHYDTVGLKRDGTVVAVGDNDYGQCDVSGWSDIIAVSAGRLHTVGLKRDGTVVATGSNNFGQCDVSGWSDIIAVSAGEYHTVGLKRDGTVVAVGYNDDGRCDVSVWSDIIAVSAGGYHTVGLKKDGTVVAVGDNDYGQCDVSGWRDIIAVSAGINHTVGLKKDGTVVAVGDNFNGQCNVSGWELKTVEK